MAIFILEMGILGVRNTCVGINQKSKMQSTLLLAKPTQLVADMFAWSMVMCNTHLFCFSFVSCAWPHRSLSRRPKPHDNCKPKSKLWLRRAALLLSSALDWRLCRLLLALALRRFYRLNFGSCRSLTLGLSLGFCSWLDIPGLGAETQGEPKGSKQLHTK